MAPRVVMLLPNNPYPRDVRVRNEAGSLVNAGYAVRVIAPRVPGQQRRETVDGVEVLRFRLTPDRQTAAWLALELVVVTLQLNLRALAELIRGAHVLHLHNPPDTLFPAGLVARAMGRAVVYDHHDLVPELFAERFAGLPLGGLFRLTERASMRTANVVLAANESHREIALERGGVAAERVAVVRNGPRASAIAEGPTPREGVLEDPHLLFLGELAAQDGVDELPALLERLRSDHGIEAARLTVVGEGPRRTDLERACARAGLAERVRFTGQVPHEAVPELLASADVCVDPAPCGELNHRSTMVKIAEYLAAGKPVVAHRLRETERTAGDAALYADCADPAALAANVARLARDPRLRGELEHAATQRARELTWERSEEVLLRAYSGLASAPSGANA